ncbi:MAG: hypothetical protein V1921_08605 [Candidatus Altiarchaeota archaeon]
MNTKDCLPILILLLASTAASWGPKTHEYFCQQAVANVWGVDTFRDCFERVSRYDLCNAASEYYYGTCVSDPVQPWLMPDLLFKDYGLQEDYSTCPIQKISDRSWICGNSSENYASKAGDFWLEQAVNSLDICQRVQRFCIASNYYAKALFPLHQTKYETEKCRSELKEKVDSFIGNNSANWSVSQICAFSGVEQKAGRALSVSSHYTFIVSDDEVGYVLDNLSQKASSISTKPYVTTTVMPLKPMAELVVVNITDENALGGELEGITESLNESVQDVIGIIGKVNETIVKGSGDQTRDYRLIKLFFQVIIVAGLLSIGYAIFTKRVLTYPLSMGNLMKMPGMDEDSVKKLNSAGIVRIQEFMKQEPKMISKAAGIPVKKIAEWRESFIKAVDDYFSIDSTLGPDDLTEHQLKVLRRMKMEINRAMRKYRSQEELGERDKKGLQKIMGPLNDEERGEVQRIIDGVVDIRDDKPYRILVTSSKTGMKRLGGIDWQKEIKGGG